MEAGPNGQVPLDRLGQIAPACLISRARVVDAGRIITAGGIASGMELGFHLLRRAGYDEAFVRDIARVMEYTAAYDVYRDDLEVRGGADVARIARGENEGRPAGTDQVFQTTER